MSLGLGDIDKAALNALADKLAAEARTDEAELIKGLLDAETNLETIADRLLDKFNEQFAARIDQVVADFNTAISRLNGASLSMEPIAPKVTLTIPERKTNE